MIDKYNYETLNSKELDIYNDVDCIHYSGLHDYIKFLKFGYSKIHDHCSREIRLKRLTRNRFIFNKIYLLKTKRFKYIFKMVKY